MCSIGQEITQIFFPFCFQVIELKLEYRESQTVAFILCTNLKKLVCFYLYLQPKK